MSDVIWTEYKQTYLALQSYLDALRLNSALLAKNERGFKLFLTLGHNQQAFWRFVYRFELDFGDGVGRYQTVHTYREHQIHCAVVEMLAFAPFKAWHLIGKKEYERLIYS